MSGKPESIVGSRGAVSPAGSTVSQLPGRWRAEAATLRCFGAESQALTLEKAASDLERVVAATEDSLLSLHEAAIVSGFSSDHLRRLARTQKLSCERKGRRLFFRRGDLPQRPAARVDEHAWSAYDPRADASKVAAGRHHGGHNGTTATA
jgi:hypothetical protein